MGWMVVDMGKGGTKEKKTAGIERNEKEIGLTWRTESSKGKAED